MKYLIQNRFNYIDILGINLSLALFWNGYYLYGGLAVLFFALNSVLLEQFLTYKDEYEKS